MFLSGISSVGMSVFFTKRLVNRLSSRPSSIFKYCASFHNSFNFLKKDKEMCAESACNNVNESVNHCHNIKLPTMFPSNKNYLHDVKIELVDPHVWPQTRLIESETNSKESKPIKIIDDSNNKDDAFMDFDEVDDLRLHHQLFYKLDKGSREFEEYNIDFHRKKSSKKELKKKKEQDIKKECKELEKQAKEEIKNRSKENIKKRVRIETFNQLTAPYHMPFCLDIFITKGSVRASIIHRVTSRVVAVAHSISKDLKFDLKSRKDLKACSTVGSVLAQRAIEDDIHNVVYTPRKGDRIEGKLEAVLKAVVDNGVDVKVKLKQRKHLKRAQMQCSSIA